MIATCIKNCFDGIRLHSVGNQADIDPTSDVAIHFKFSEKESEKEALLEEAKALGIEAKGTWGIPKLTEEIAKVKEAKAKESQ